MFSNGAKLRGPYVVVSTAAFHARVQGSFPGFSGLKKKILPHPVSEGQCHLTYVSIHTG